MGYVKHNYFVPLPEADSFEALNQKLLAECLAYGDHRLQGREKTVNEFFLEEHSGLLPLPAVPFHPHADPRRQSGPLRHGEGG